MGMKFLATWLEKAQYTQMRSFDEKFEKREGIWEIFLSDATERNEERSLLKNSRLHMQRISFLS